MNSKFFTAALLFLILASCGQPKGSQGSESQQVTTMTDEVFASKVQKIFLSLPEYVLPQYYYETPEIRHPSGGDHDDFNCRVLGDEWFSETDEGVEFYARWRWNMAVYLTNDHQNAVIVIHYMDQTKPEREDTQFTLNYHIKSGAFTKIEVDEDSFSLMDAFDQNDPLYDEIGEVVEYMPYAINYSDYVDYWFDKDGFSVRIDYFGYWSGFEDDYSSNMPLAKALERANVFHYVWDGKRFELVDSD
ncbi:MAG: hypothetical protein LBC84_09605 [Prevotellaceae bacterium]|jgi:hypothetical protein|nr:hypothetical protein [Prevotellaceae bacterium]